MVGLRDGVSEEAPPPLPVFRVFEKGSEAEGGPFLPATRPTVDLPGHAAMAGASPLGSGGNRSDREPPVFSSTSDATRGVFGAVSPAGMKSERSAGDPGGGTLTGRNPAREENPGRLGVGPGAPNHH